MTKSSFDSSSSRKNEADLHRAQQMIEEQAAKIKELEAKLLTLDKSILSDNPNLRCYGETVTDESSTGHQNNHSANIMDITLKRRGSPQFQQNYLIRPQEKNSELPFNRSILEKGEKSLRSSDYPHILTREERLEAHKLRKRSENKVSHESGKWESPPPLPKNNKGLARVRENDELVHRLTSDPVQRKMIDVIQKRVRKNTKCFQPDLDDHDHGVDLTDIGPSTSVARNRSGRTMGSKKKKCIIKSSSLSSNTDAEKRRDALMQRLSMSLKDRRKLMKKQDDVPDTVNRSLRGHKLKKTVWAMADQFQFDNGISEHEFDMEKTTNEIQCQTCNSTSDCEEDVDNPGTYYCATCWRNYEHGMTDTSPTYIPKGKIDETNHRIDKLKLSDEKRGMAQLDKKPLRSTMTLDRELPYSKRLREASKENFPDQCLWILHDNHKLVHQVVCSGPKQMRCIVETKEPGRKNAVRMLIGLISYCGKLPTRRHGLISDDLIDRGSECLCISDIQGFYIDHSSVETRLSNDSQVYEYKLPLHHAVQLTGAHSTSSLKKFFEACTESVDVILDPQTSPGNWFPIREAVRSMKTIAPQFRSKGIGYIRLGDDMGRNGVAFLSSDGCETFFSSLSKVSNQIEASHLKRSLSLNNLYHTEEKVRSRARSVGNMRPSTNFFDDYESTDQGSYDDISSSKDEHDEDDSSFIDEDVGELLKQLQNLELSNNAKWRDKTELITKMGKVMRRNSSALRIHGSAALTYLQDIIGAKNVNIHVLRVSLISVGMIGHKMRSELASHIAWKTIMIEMLKLLKNKQVSSTVKDILRQMHRYNAYTLSSSLPLIAHVLGVSKSGSRATISAPKTKKTVSASTPASADVPSQNSNNIDVIEWLAETTEIERSMEYIDTMLDEKGLSTLAHFFINYMGHRDATCRKNACDGILHTLLYGVSRLNIIFDECCVLCGQEIIENSHSKIWPQIIKAARTIIKEESRDR